uniref:Uncharacterized protein n=1 Tax=Anguilla anguilla TaxID=7936 RepID=A0A0E9T1N7_ANGAN
MQFVQDSISIMSIKHSLLMYLFISKNSWQVYSGDGCVCVEKQNLKKHLNLS